MLFSATQTTKVEDLARISLKPGPLYINVDHRAEHSTVQGLEQGYVLCDSDTRFRLLFSFLKKRYVTIATYVCVCVFVLECFTNFEQYVSDVSGPCPRDCLTMY